MEKWLFYLGIALAIFGFGLTILSLVEIVLQPGIFERPPLVPAAALALSGFVLLRNSKKKQSGQD